MARLQLYTKGKAINKWPRAARATTAFRPMTRMSKTSAARSTFFLLARRPKAIDMTDTDAVLVNYDPDSEEFKRIAA